MQAHPWPACSATCNTLQLRSRSISRTTEIISLFRFIVRARFIPSSSRMEYWEKKWRLYVAQLIIDRNSYIIVCSSTDFLPEIMQKLCYQQTIETENEMIKFHEIYDWFVAYYIGHKWLVSIIIYNRQVDCQLYNIIDIFVRWMFKNFLTQCTFSLYSNYPNTFNLQQYPQRFLFYYSRLRLNIILLSAWEMCKVTKQNRR